MQNENRKSLSEQIHRRACEAARQHRKVEAELLEVLQQVDQSRVFLARGYSSLFLYVVKELALSESVAYNLISVARKAREVPELKTEIQNGAITLSNARKIVPVLTKENKTEWLVKASRLSQRLLEKEVVKVRPQEAIPEKATYVTGSRIKLELGLSEKDMLKLRRVQDLLCQSRKRPVSLVEAIVSLTGDYLTKHDPVEMAKRQKVKTGLQKIEPKIELPRGAGKDQSEQNPSKSVETPVSLQARAPIPAQILHQVNLRDQRRCTHTDSNGETCNQTRWIEIHHVKPVSLGGTNALQNLKTLCSAHHRWIHLHGGH